MSAEAARAGKMVPVGKYKVTAHIATGGMGAVYKAIDTETGQEVALKVLNNKMANRPDMLERFNREAKNAAQLQHENIVRVFEVGEHKGVIYLAMELIDGVDLHDYIAQNGPLSPEDARRVTFQAARALHHAHKRGIIHRDIKPSNFLLSRKNSKLLVKLTDLGLSRQVDKDEYRVTRVGHTVGTVDYISPEQARDSGLADIRSDIYSLGCTLYHMLTGEPPFPEGGLGERIYKHIETEPTDVRQLRTGVPDALAGILKKMLAKKPEDRYQSPRDLMHALAKLEDPEAPPVSPTPVEQAEPETTEEAVLEQESTVEAPIEPEPALTKSAHRKAKKSKKKHKTAAVGQGISNGLLALAAGGVLVVLGLLLLLLRPWEGSKPDDVVDKRVDDKPKVPTDDSQKKDDNGKPDDSDKPKDPPKPPPPDPDWPPLIADARLKLDALASTFQEGWEDAVIPADVPVFRVQRQPGEGGYASLAEAARAVQERGGVGLPAGPRAVDAIIEIADNGPLYETSSAFTGKRVLVRAAAGFRPLLFWDLEKEKEHPPPPLLRAQSGALMLEGLDVVLHATRRPEDARACMVEVKDGDFQARRCSFSTAGVHPQGVTAVRLHGGGRKDEITAKILSARSRINQCCFRGAALTALEIARGHRLVLIQDSLLSGGEKPLIDLAADFESKLQLHLLRATLVGRGTALRAMTEELALTPETVRILSWDTLVARNGSGPAGLLVELHGKGLRDNLKWDPQNTLFLGWAEKVRGPMEAPAKWEDVRVTYAAERHEVTTWPAAVFAEPGETAVAEYSTKKESGAPVGYALTSWPVLIEKAAAESSPRSLGCPVAMLPSPRERWQQWTVQRYPTPPVELLTRSTPVEIPSASDGRFHGERIDISRVELGAYLTQVQQRRPFAPKVILHLYRSGDAAAKPLTPFRVAGSDVVIFCEPYKKQAMGKEPATTERLLLVADDAEARKESALITMAGGSLDIIGGDWRYPDVPQAALPASLIRMQGGSILRLHDCHLYGPLTDAADSFRTLIRSEPGDKGRTIAINESILVSNHAILVAHGRALKIRLSGSVAVSPEDALELEPGAGGAGRKDVTCTFDRATFAAGRAVVRLTGTAGSLEEPYIFQSRGCAFLNPYEARAGLLLLDKDMLPSGQVLWQSDLDVYDRRLHFGVATLHTIPEKEETFVSWERVWGPPGTRRALAEFPQALKFDREQPVLERLVLTPTGVKPEQYDTRGIGADWLRLGLPKKKPK